MNLLEIGLSYPPLHRTLVTPPSFVSKNSHAEVDLQRMGDSEALLLCVACHKDGDTGVVVVEAKKIIVGSSVLYKRRMMMDMLRYINFVPLAFVRSCCTSTVEEEASY